MNVTGNAPRVSGTARGVCAECDRSYRVDGKGRLHPHPHVQDPRATVHVPGRCGGSHKPPREDH